MATIYVALLLIVLGFILLIKGSTYLVDGSSYIAKRFHIPQIVIGLTVVSIGTSLPELFVSTSSALKGHTDMQIGNVIGSNICNLLLILGVSASINRIKLKKETRYIEMPICFLLTILFAVFCNTGNRISKPEAVVLIILFIAFIGFTVFMAIKGEKFDKEKQKTGENEEEEEEIVTKEENSRFPVLTNAIRILIGIIGLKFGGDLIVDNATFIAEFYNISEKIISLTILAIGTSLPELATSIVASIEKNSDISIGNIIGSNIFNMTAITGVSSMINPIEYNVAYNLDLKILLFATFALLLFPIIPPKNCVSKRNGALYLVLYLIYSIILFKS